MLACLSTRDAGDLTVLGMDPNTDARARGARLGVVPQEINLDVELTVLENMLVYARYFGIARAAATTRAHDLLAFVGLEERGGDTVDHLSGGMQRRLQIARALINDPEMILLDEPTTGLDPQGTTPRVGAATGTARRGHVGRHQHPLHGRGRAAVRPARGHGPRTHHPRRGAARAH